MISWYAKAKFIDTLGEGIHDDRLESPLHGKTSYSLRSSGSKWQLDSFVKFLDRFIRDAIFGEFPEFVV